MKAKILFPVLLFGALAFGQTDEKTSTGKIDENSKPEMVNQDSIPEKPLRDVPWFVERFRIGAGFYKVFNGTNVKIESSSIDNGTEVDFEDDLGFNKSSQTFIADFEWRLSSRSRFNLSYYNSKRSADKVLDKTLVIGDETYEINTEVYAFIHSEFYRFSYGYAILSKPKYEVGLLIGTHTISTKMGIGAKGENANLERNKNYDFTAPLIDLGIWGGYAFNDRWAVKGEFNYFQIKIDNLEGKTLGYNLSGVYKVLKNLELSAGFSGLNFNVDLLKKNLAYDLNWGYNGMTLMAAYTFGNKKWK